MMLRQPLRILVLVILCMGPGPGAADHLTPRELKVAGGGIWQEMNAVVAVGAWTFGGGTLSITDGGTKVGVVTCIVGEPGPKGITTEAFMEVVFIGTGVFRHAAAYAGRYSFDDPISRFALIYDHRSPCRHDESIFQLLRSLASPMIGAFIVDSDCDRGPCPA